MRVDGSRIRKEKVADLKISGYLWTRPYSVVENTGKKYNNIPFHALQNSASIYYSSGMIYNNSESKTYGNRFKTAWAQKKTF